ncbi:hypothetical protein ACRRTK_017501 [Alexandromys fortis]
MTQEITTSGLRIIDLSRAWASQRRRTGGALKSWLAQPGSDLWFWSLQHPDISTQNNLQVVKHTQGFHRWA